MKQNKKQNEIKSALELLSSNEIKLKEEKFNIIILKTNNGIKKIKTQLSLQDWLKVNQLKHKQPKKKK